MLREPGCRLARGNGIKRARVCARLGCRRVRDRVGGGCSHRFLRDVALLLRFGYQARSDNDCQRDEARRRFHQAPVALTPVMDGDS